MLCIYLWLLAGNEMAKRNKRKVLKLHCALKYNFFKLMLVYENFVKVHLQGKVWDILDLRKCKYYKM